VPTYEQDREEETDEALYDSPSDTSREVRKWDDRSDEPGAPRDTTVEKGDTGAAHRTHAAKLRGALPAGSPAMEPAIDVPAAREAALPCTPYRSGAYDSPEKLVTLYAPTPSMLLPLQ
jgi:hypothetical protein